MAEKLMAEDSKGEASIVLGGLLKSTADNFPDPQFRMDIVKGKSVIDPSPFAISTTADGIGTKPELAERLFMISEDPNEFESLAYDLCAMIDGDAARDGLFLLGITEILDVNSAADIRIIKALATGLKKAADEGRFAILNGETAELGYRTGGYGVFNMNWNASGITLDVPEKRITGERLMPGQSIVAFREKSMRSNGYSKARQILDTSARCADNRWMHNYNAGIRFFLEQGLRDGNTLTNTSRFLKHTGMLNPILEAAIPRWHEVYPEIARQLKMPSSLYGPIIYDAQGGIFGDPQVDIIAAAHITGGGIPLKGKRMVDQKGLGISVDQIFPDPVAVESVLNLANSISSEVFPDPLIDDISACEQWNRGIGFMVVVPDEEEAKKLIYIAGQHKCEAAIAGEVIDEPAVKFLGHTWFYKIAA